MQSQATTVAQYLREPPEDRRQVIEAVRQTILKNLARGYEEGMQYGMISYFVPHSRYPSGYHCDSKQPLPFILLASQKNYISLYMFCVYSTDGSESWFSKAWTDAGKKLNMGKSCVRFKKIEDVPLDVVGQAVKRYPVKKYIEQYEASLEAATQGSDPSGKRRAVTSKQRATKKTAAKKASAKKKPVKKKAATGAKKASKKRKR